MEIVIPPRDHGPSTYRYTWDENGEVQQVTRYAPRSPHDRRQAESLIANRVRDESSLTRTPPEQRPRRGRQTVQWPFQSVVTEEEVSSPITVSAFARRATWQPRRARDQDEYSIEQDLIPDYVVNYIRGETPETVARRQRNGGKLGERDVHIAHQHRPHQSRAAEFEGFRSPNGSTRPSDDGSADEDLRQILSSSREKLEKGWRQFLVGWRAGVALNTLLAFLILLVDFVCLIVAGSRGSPDSGKSVIFAGPCVTASGISWGIYAVFNLFALVLIAGANYVFQVLGSPTRTEVAVAHFRRRWLDVGVPSFRNLGQIGSGRTVLAVVVLLAAAFAQVMFVIPDARTG